MWLFNLLDSTSANEGANPAGNNYMIYIILGLVVVFFIVSTIISGKQRKKQQAAEQEKRDSMKPGFIVTTIGGIKGTVVEVDSEANTFVLETGRNGSGNYIQFDKQAIYQIEDPNAAQNVLDEAETQKHDESDEQNVSDTETVETEEKQEEEKE